MTFRVGQRVVCVDDKFDELTLAAASELPSRGNLYTIRGFSEGADASGQRRTGLLLQELRNPNKSPFGESGEHCFNPIRFRPVQERKTDISVFLAMLNPSQVTVDAG